MVLVQSEVSAQLLSILLMPGRIFGLLSLQRRTWVRWGFLRRQYSRFSFWERLCSCRGLFLRNTEFWTRLYRVGHDGKSMPTFDRTTRLSSRGGSFRDQALLCLETICSAKNEAGAFDLLRAVETNPSCGTILRKYNVPPNPCECMALHLWVSKYSY